MSELNLPACPICLAKDSLSRQTLEREGKPFIWHACAECESVLLWLGDDQWAYQKVGREDKTYLLKQPMTTSDLRELLPSIEEVPAVPSTMEVLPGMEHPEPAVAPIQQQRTRWTPSRLLLLGLAATILCFVAAVIVVMVVWSPREHGGSMVLLSPTVSATPTPAATPVPMFVEGDQTELCDPTGKVDVWAMGDGCNLQGREGRSKTGVAARIGAEWCFNAEYGTWFYFVYFGDNPAGWVDQQKLVALPNHCPPTPTSSVPTKPVPTPDRRSPFEKCVQSGRGVRYVISGTGVTRVSLTWENDTGGTNQGESTLPVCKAFTGFQRGDFLYISAQIVAPTSGAGSITCRIYDGASVIAEAQARGFPSIATCNGLAR
jgi:hypothetical protein